jgi:hypothetical protein
VQVANEVETEQIVEAGIDYKSGKPLITSLVQVRAWINTGVGSLIIYIVQVIKAG